MSGTKFYPGLYTLDQIMEAIQAAMEDFEPCLMITDADIAAQRRWSAETFGPGPRTNGVVAHIHKELAEILAEPEDLMEWVDVMILAIDGAWRSGHGSGEIINAYKAKMEENFKRTWPDWRESDEDTAIEHDRSKDHPIHNNEFLGSRGEA